jgi:hypothetical protein
LLALAFGACSAAIAERGVCAIRANASMKLTSNLNGLRMADYSKKLKKILSANGCRFDKTGKGDHDTWFSPINGRRFTVDDCIKSRHTANEALKQAGIEKQF